MQKPATLKSADSSPHVNPDAWLRAVERDCAARDLALTPLRRKVLEIIAVAPAPLGAYAILEILSRGAARRLAPPTVYRALEFFLEHGFLHKIESRNAFAACEHIGHAHHGVLMVCGACGHTDEVESPAVANALSEVASSAGFASAAQMLEVRGLCRTCAPGGA